MENKATPEILFPFAWPFKWMYETWEYSLDALQRSFLFIDVLSQRSARYHDHEAKNAPNVLKFGWELEVDGRKLPNPVNYALVRIVPPDGERPDKYKRPFIIVDPRAGHGPGIGGFKPMSEIGVAIKAGHPCYFIGFLPDPIPGQTIERPLSMSRVLKRFSFNTLSICIPKQKASRLLLETVRQAGPS